MKKLLRITAVVAVAVSALLLGGCPTNMGGRSTTTSHAGAR